MESVCWRRSCKQVRPCIGRRLLIQNGNVNRSWETTGLYFLSAEFTDHVSGICLDLPFLKSMEHWSQYRSSIADFDFSFMLYYSFGGGHLADHMHKSHSSFVKLISISSDFHQSERWKPGDETDVPRLTVDGTSTYNGGGNVQLRFIYRTIICDCAISPLRYNVPRAFCLNWAWPTLNVYVTGDQSAYLRKGQTARNRILKWISQATVQRGSDKNGSISSRMYAHRRHSNYSLMQDVWHQDEIK